MKSVKLFFSILSVLFLAAALLTSGNNYQQNTHNELAINKKDIKVDTFAAIDKGDIKVDTFVAIDKEDIKVDTFV